MNLQGTLISLSLILATWRPHGVTVLPPATLCALDLTAFSNPSTGIYTLANQNAKGVHICFFRYLPDRHHVRRRRAGSHIQHRAPGYRIAGVAGDVLAVVPLDLHNRSVMI